MDSIKKFKATLKDKKLDGFIVTNPYNICYLSGFKGMSDTERESILVLNPDATLLAPRLYQSEALSLKNAQLTVQIVKERNHLIETISTLLKNKKRVGFEQSDLKYSEFLELKKLLKGSEFVPSEDLIENLRWEKSESENEKIEKAQVISQKAFDQLLPKIKINQTEEEIAEKLLSIIKKLGGQGLAFESIIASGQNSARPHHKTSNRKIKKGEVLLLDFGTKYQNYCADLSRSIFIGNAKDEHKNIFFQVKNAQQKAIAQIKKGTKTSEAFHFANDHFKNLNLDVYFTHGLGHGIGLEVHERPYLRASMDDDLKENMIFSIEPGLYMPWGGIRIEDLVVIKNGKAKVLGKKQEDLIVI